MPVLIKIALLCLLAAFVFAGCRALIPSPSVGDAYGDLVSELAGKHLIEGEPVRFRGVEEGGRRYIEAIVTAHSPIRRFTLRGLRIDGVEMTFEPVSIGPLEEGRVQTVRVAFVPSDGTHRKVWPAVVRYALIWEDGFALTDSTQQVDLRFYTDQD